MLDQTTTMTPIPPASDVAILDLLRRSGPRTVSELSAAIGVTATAVRQRLNRLMGQRLLERTVARAPRGRPTHRYAITEKGKRQAGANFADLTIALWHEIRAIEDPLIQRGLLQRLAKRLAAMYGGQMSGRTLAERLNALCDLLGDREVPFRVEPKRDGSLPILTAVACPYPALAEQDRSICAMEKILFAELLGSGVKLTECRLDGASCCTFEMN